ncbi:protein kinase domain-containing protein [Gemmatirosa kalamazoonensis]|nr:protein kinase [Gemmatirosa kalamazoonensis]
MTTGSLSAAHLTGLATTLAGRYRLERELGAGGMATVWLADDQRHRRRVAIKVLHPELSVVLGPERFLAEIRTTANLQHPHILPPFDSGSAEGLLYYVMPYVEGETLRTRLERERQLPVPEAVRFATEVADALDYAHRHGVVHRDIKPENILLQDGHVVVADFGIALAVQQAGGSRMTQTGLSLGTPHYMAPEQAMGERTIDARADVYALGAVTYEMLAGTPPFTGPNAQAIVARVLTERPISLARARDSVPPQVDAAVALALSKLPADRPASAREFAAALHDPSLLPAGTVSAAVAAPAVRIVPRASRLALAGGAVCLVGGLVAAAWAWGRTRAVEPPPLVPLTLELPGASPELARFAVSPDGARFAFATDSGIAVRDPGRRDYRLLAGTVGAESPAFSPDGAWIVFAANGHLQKVAVDGGTPLGLVPRDSLLAGRVDWGDDGTIVFESGNRLYLIPPAGGAPRRLAGAPDAQSPHVMPDGRGVLFVSEQRGTKLMYYDVASDTAYVVLDEATEGRYVATGHIVYGHPNGGLFAMRFDRARHAVSGEPIPIVSDVQQNGAIAPFVITRSGTLVYRSGVESEARLLLRDPGGRLDTLRIPPSVFGYARFSPDGRALALTVGSARGTNRYTAIFDLSLGTLSRVTSGGGGHSPIWSPDGKRLAFTAEGENTDAEDLFILPVDRHTGPVHLFRRPNDQHATAWPSDTVLVFTDNGTPRAFGGPANGITGAGIGVVNPASGTPTPRVYLKSPWSQSDAAVSPDGRYAAFTSDESGVPEIYIRPFPVADAGGQWKVSAGGGQRARWSGDGRTVFYHGRDGRTIYRVPVHPGPPLTFGARELVATIPGLGGAWDVDRHGRMLLTQTVASRDTRIVVTANWLEHFRRDAAAKR